MDSLITNDRLDSLRRCIELAAKRWHCMKAEAFDRKFEAGEDITANLDMERATRPRLQARRVNVDFPAWMVDELDREATRLDVTRQSVIKVWLSERLEQTASSHARSQPQPCTRS